MSRTALADALAAVRASGAAEPEIERRLSEIFATETERVASAAVLAELLAPMLQNAAVPQTAVASSQPAGLPAAEMPRARVPEPAAAAPPPPERAPAPAPARPGDIAHFIDEMLAHERAELRRAS